MSGDVWKPEYSRDHRKWAIEDWEKPRSRGDHLTEQEIAFIRSQFIARAKIMDTAKYLACSSRTVVKYYGYFRAEGIEQIGGHP